MKKCKEGTHKNRILMKIAFLSVFYDFINVCINLYKINEIVGRHLYKKILKISLHILAFKNIPKFFYFFPTKTYIFIADKGFAPPPLTDMSANM